MPHEESLYPADWLRIAEKDLLRVQWLLDVDDAEGGGFFLQQALEKFLKAFLLFNGWRLQRTHDLESLLNEAVRHEPSLEKYRSVLQKISGFYFIERYPFPLDMGLTMDDVRDALAGTEGLICSIRNTVAQ